MQYPVFKSLDNPSSMLGLKGSYLKFAAIGVGVALIIGFGVGSATNGLIGIIVFIAVSAVAYFAVMAFQARFTERERKKWFSSRKLPDIITLEPRTFGQLAAGRLGIAKRIKAK